MAHLIWHFDIVLLTQKSKFKTLFFLMTKQWVQQTSLVLIHPEPHLEVWVRLVVRLRNKAVMTAGTHNAEE